MHYERRIAIGLLLIGLLGGCDSRDEQNSFEDEAFQRPYEGYSETTASGEVIRRDADDWRVAPRYASSVDISQPAYPNPPQGVPVIIEVNVLFNNGLQGELILYGIDVNNRLQVLDRIPNSRNAGFYTFNFSPVQLPQDGLTRVFIYDTGGGIISYGDIKLD